MKNKYRLEKTQLDNKWDDFNSSSPTATAFTSSTYLKSIPICVDAYYCYKANELMASLTLIVDQDRKNITGNGLVIHDGIAYRNLSHLNQAQQHSEQYSIQQYIAETLPQMYKNIHLSLHPNITDIRSFLWVNYHNDNPKYNAIIRYTSIVDISHLNKNTCLGDNPLYLNSSVARRQEIRYSRKKNVVTQETQNSELMIQLYQKTLERQGISIDDGSLNIHKALVDSLLKEHQAIMFKSTTQEGEVGSFALYLLNNTTAHFIYGANDPLLRNKHTGTAVLWESFYTLAAKGIKQVNLEGINSPQRGWFKLSFGGNIVPYYQLTYSDH